jgi:hypothetical protein
MPEQPPPCTPMRNPYSAGTLLSCIIILTSSIARGDRLMGAVLVIVGVSMIIEIYGRKSNYYLAILCTPLLCLFLTGGGKK